MQIAFTFSSTYEKECIEFYNNKNLSIEEINPIFVQSAERKELEKKNK